MTCISPINIPDPKYKKQAVRILVPCGRCAFCMENKRKMWSIRLLEELKESSSAWFITLTYNDKNLKKDGVKLVDFQLFMKKLRRAVEPLKIRFFAVSEYGSKTYRPHYHMILFNLESDQDLVHRYVSKAWDQGNIHIGNVNEATISYVCKYIHTRQKIPKGMNKNFSTMSRKPGIGFQYIEKMKNYHEDPDKFHYTHMGGEISSLPEYYRKKLYGENDRANNADKIALIADQREYERQKAYKGEKSYHEWRSEQRLHAADLLNQKIQKFEKL